MTELLPHAWDTRGGVKGLPSSNTSQCWDCTLLCPPASKQKNKKKKKPPNAGTIIIT